MISKESSKGFGEQGGAEGQAASDVVAVELPLLKFGQSPRLVPEDVGHARMLAELGHVLPPILVHAETMLVIDGRHRVLAARLRGETSVRARLFHGSDDAAYFAGVQSNTMHGKPLSLAERLRAASRILKSKPDLSDRAVARVCGLSPRTVAKRRKDDPTGDLTHRVGADGRRRPLSSTIAREQAAELILAFPDDSNRSIACSVGLSEGTVRDVRRQLELAASTSQGKRGKAVTAMSDGPPHPEEKEPRESTDLRDASADEGALFASWLVAHSIAESSWADLLDDIPSSRLPQVIVEALSISDSWRALAARLERRVRRDAS